MRKRGEEKRGMGLFLKKQIIGHPFIFYIFATDLCIVESSALK